VRAGNAMRGGERWEDLVEFYQVCKEDSPMKIGLANDANSSTQTETNSNMPTV
jgi:carbonic anhydrase